MLVKESNPWIFVDGAKCFNLRIEIPALLLLESVINMFSVVKSPGSEYAMKQAFTVCFAILAGLFIFVNAQGMESVGCIESYNSDTSRTGDPKPPESVPEELSASDGLGYDQEASTVFEKYLHGAGVVVAIHEDADWTSNEQESYANHVYNSWTLHWSIFQGFRYNEYRNLVKDDYIVSQGFGAIQDYPFQSGGLPDEMSNNSLLLEYREYGGMDTYSVGDKAGIALYVCKSGRAKLMDLIVSSPEKGSRLEEIFTAEFNISDDVISSMHSMFRDNDFHQWPAYLPDGPPWEIQVRTPAPRIKIRYAVDSEVKQVKANLGADNRYYPDGFFKVRAFVMELIDLDR